MQRQKSILSFFKKPTPSTMSSGEDNPFSKQQNPRGSVKAQPELNPSVEASIETDTPPAKVPRQVLPSNFTASKDTQGTSLFSSIAHKFVKIDSSEKSQERKQFYAADRSKESQVLLKDGFAGFHYEKSNGVKSNGTTAPQRSILNVENDDVTEPETPGMRPVVPRLKRVQEDAPKLEDKNVSSLLGISKRLKLDQELAIPSKIQGESSDVISKFEWLNPSKIRDANGRRPDNPLYDKNTLFIPPDALKKMSASQKQYWTVKSQYMDVMLFFKVGKFYELYELDAEIGHKELDWKITLSGVGKCRQVGISESGIDDAVGKLVARGYKVGRIEQLETSDQAKARGGNSVIQRKLVQVITPATMSQTVCPDAVYLLALKEVSSSLNNGATIYGFAFVDCSAQYFWVGSVHDDASCAALGALLMQVSPKEVIYESRGVSKESQKALRKYSLTGSTAIQLTPVVSATDFLDASAVRNLIQSKDYFGGSSYPWCTSENGAMHHDAALCALGGLIEHLSRLMLDDVLRNGDIMPYHVYKGCLKIDGQTLVNLEIFNNNADGGSSGTLLNYLDNCLTSSGKRLLRKWICHPLKDVEGINNRLNVVEGLMNHPEFMSITGQYLRKLPDLERMLGRVKASMQASAAILLPLFGKKILRQRVKLFGSLVKGLRAGMDLLMMLQTDSQIISSLGNIFKLPELDGASGLDKFLVQFEAAIDSEFPNYQNHDVTDAEAETLSILIELFVEKAKQWSEVIYALSCVDVLRSFAVTASMSCGTVCRPVIYPQSGTSTNCQGARGSVLKIKGLWHPFALGENGSLPVPNDIILGEDAEGYQPRTLLLTGPNMGGKSTILRATCLAVILAQLGCFVPGEKCILSLVDVIFTRLGATDRIMTGESTFFVECTETASVLQNATQDSLVILDELGRGTSTFDGYAIAYSVFRHLVDKINCRLLFATHYHALTKEFASHPHVKLQHMGCAFKSTSENEYRDLVFLYRLTCGPCPESYGLQVATMAGVPDSVVKSASQAAQRMKALIGKRFRSSEQRSEFSTLHEEWLKNLLSISRMGESEREDDDVHDTLICLWHELRSSYQLYK